MKRRTILYADKGKILTNGVIYGRQIFLADDISDDNFHEITEEEYQDTLKAEEEARKEKSRGQINYEIKNI